MAAVDGWAFFAVAAHEFVVEWEVHLHAGGAAEVGAQAQIVFGGAAAYALFHFGVRFTRKHPCDVRQPPPAPEAPYL